MNCTFKILWFEDEELWYSAQARMVKQALEEHCLEADIQRQAGDDFEPASLQGNNNDLILMDYKLASDQTGDALISSIRTHDVLTDILFYSSQYFMLHNIVLSGVLF